MEEKLPTASKDQEIPDTAAAIGHEAGPPGDQQSHCLVEEEYTVAVSLVRPTHQLQLILRQAGASGEIFTMKEICRYLKDYIAARQLYDPEDPRVVYCADDPLGAVFAVERFTIDDVLELLSRTCSQVPDTCLKRKRYLVRKPTVTLPQSTSVTIAVGRASPIITSTTSSYQRLPRAYPSHNRRSSRAHGRSSTASSRSSPTAARAGQGSMQDEGEAGDVTASSQRGLQHGSPGNSRLPIATVSTSRTMSEQEGRNHNKRKRKRRKKSKGTSESSAASSSRTGQGSATAGSSSRKPDELPGNGGRSRKRGASLSITYSDTEPSLYPWYFRVQMGQEDQDSEVLSVQDKDTMPVQDSTDDLWFLEESDVEFSLEYDVDSDSVQLSESDLSSVKSGEGLLVVCKDSDVEFFADSSSSESESDDMELTEDDKWRCQECYVLNPPLQRYCSRCWKLRSGWLPDTLAPPGNQDKTQCSCPPVHSVEAGKPGVESLDSGVGSMPNISKPGMESLDSGVGSMPNSSQELLLPVCGKDLPETQDLSQSCINTEVRHTFANFRTSSTPLPSTASADATPLDTDRRKCGSLKSVPPVSDPCVKSVPPVSDPCVKSVPPVSDLCVKCVPPVSDPCVKSVPPVSDPCVICLTRPKTASIIHGSSGHQVCCFSCARRLKRHRKACPVCRRPIQKVVKNYIL